MSEASEAKWSQPAGKKLSHEGGRFQKETGPFLRLRDQLQLNKNIMKYRLQNIIVDPEKATRSWREAQDSNGRNLIGRLTRSQWHSQELHRYASGRYFLEHLACVSGEDDTIEEVTHEEAALWLLNCEFELPEELQHLKDALSP